MREVRPRLRSKAELVRFADDFVIVFSNGDDAQRVREVLPKRFERFELTLHEEKRSSTVTLYAYLLLTSNCLLMPQPRSLARG